MLIKPASDIRSSEITDKKLYSNRREFIRAAAGTGGGCRGGAGVFWRRRCVAVGRRARAARPQARERQASPLSVDRRRSRTPGSRSPPTTTTTSSAPTRTRRRSTPKSLKTEPWTVVVDGECAKPATYTLEDILKGQTLEERIYRLRCVEAWSMVIPWVGFPLAELHQASASRRRKAKFVEFYTLADPAQMPGVRSPVLRWPYIEGAAHGRGDASARRFSPSACTARCCRSRTARRSG